MNKIIKQVSGLTLAAAAVLTLAGCSGGCGGYHDVPTKHHRHARHNAPVEQEVVMVAAVEETEVISYPMVRANMVTRSSRGGTSDMGYIKIAQTDNGMKMMVDLIDLRPGKDYNIKIYKCGACSGYNCCASSCMNANLPILSINQPGRLSNTYEVWGLKWNELANAKIVLQRDGGYKAAWGKLQPVTNY